MAIIVLCSKCLNRVREWDNLSDEAEEALTLAMAKRAICTSCMNRLQLQTTGRDQVAQISYADLIKHTEEM